MLRTAHGQRLPSAVLGASSGASPPLWAPEQQGIWDTWRPPVPAAPSLPSSFSYHFSSDSLVLGFGKDRQVQMSSRPDLIRPTGDIRSSRKDAQISVLLLGSCSLLEFLSSPAPEERRRKGIPHSAGRLSHARPPQAHGERAGGLVLGRTQASSRKVQI